MDESAILARAEQAFGAGLMALVLLDVFLTVLYARMGTGVFAPRLARLTWWLFRRASDRGAVLAFCGPIILVLLVFAWGLGLTVGAALIFHSALGSAITTSSGPTPTSFAAALHAAGSSLSVVGASNFNPQTPGFRLLYLFNSLVGVSVTSLTLTYLMQVYSALLRRNAFALKLHLQAAETVDAAEWLAALGPQGRFDSGSSLLSEAASGMAEQKEAHHFYPVLFYFRFREPLYSVSRSALLALDAMTLLQTGLDDEHYLWLKESAAVAQLWFGSQRLVRTLADTFLDQDVADESQTPDAATAERWRRRFAAGLRRLRQAGIETHVDESAGAAAYVTLRSSWDRYITALAPSLGYPLDEIDPVGANPDSATQNADFYQRQRLTG